MFKKREKKKNLRTCSLTPCIYKREMSKKFEMGLWQCDSHKNIMNKSPPQAKQRRWLMQMELTFNHKLVLDSLHSQPKLGKKSPWTFPPYKYIFWLVVKVSWKWLKILQLPSAIPKFPSYESHALK